MILTALDRDSVLDDILDSRHARFTIGTFKERGFPTSGLLQTLPVRCLSAFLRSFPNAPGAWRLARHSIRQTRKHGQALREATITTRHGFRMTLQLDDWVDQHIYATGDYEEPTAKTMASLIGPGDACVDIGANIGFFTLLMSRRVGPGGAVWSFEPSPATRARLMRNVELNRAGNVTLREEAVSDIDGQSLFFGGTDHHSGTAGLRPMSDAAASFPVQTCRLATCLPAGFKPRLIKIDIEGAEFNALKGMVDLLSTHHPDLIIELTDPFLRKMGGSSAEIHALLDKLGYTMYIISWDGLVPCRRWAFDLPEQFNALFTTRASLPPEINVLPARN